MVGFAELHRIGHETVVYAFDHTQEPRHEVDAPAEILVETHDARGGKLHKPPDVIATAPDLSSEFPRTNLATEPVRIRGAEPGDTLIIDIRSIELDSYGFIVVRPQWGIVRGLVNEVQAKVLPVTDGMIEIDRFRLPARPNIGVLATAPAEGPTGTLFLGRHTAGIWTTIASLSAHASICLFRCRARCSMWATCTPPWATPRPRGPAWRSARAFISG